MPTAKQIDNAVAGVAVLLAIKYLVVGLDNWNAFFHPGRVEPPEDLRTELFSAPLMGMLS